MSIDLKPANLAENPGAPVIPASMAEQIRPSPDLPPAGHSRDELLRERRDRLDDQISQMPEMAGGIDVSLIEIENEIAHAFDDIGNLSVSNQNPEYVYKWKKADDQQVNLAQKLGFELVNGDPRNDPKCPNHEGIEHIGKHCAAGTTLRGAGDVMLWRMKRSRYEALENYYRKIGHQAGQVEANFEDYGASLAAQGMTPKNLAHGRPEDPLIQRVFANGPVQSERMDRMMRQGSLPGATAAQMFRR